MKMFTIRYAMSVDIDANSKEEAKELFESIMCFNEILKKSEFVELEDVYEN